MNLNKQLDEIFRKHRGYIRKWEKGKGMVYPQDEIKAALKKLVDEAVVANTVNMQADLAGCLGKLRGLNHPAEHLEKKYELGEQLKTRGGTE